MCIAMLISDEYALKTVLRDKKEKYTMVRSMQEEDMKS